MGEAIKPLPFYFFIIIVLNFGKLLTGVSRVWVGNSSNVPIELSNPDSSETNSNPFKLLKSKDATITFTPYNYDEDNDFGTAKYVISVDSDFVMCKMYTSTSSGYGDYCRIQATFYNYFTLDYEITGIYGDKTYESSQTIFGPFNNKYPNNCNFVYPWGNKLSISLISNKITIDGIRCIFSTNGTVGDNDHLEYAVIYY